MKSLTGNMSILAISITITLSSCFNEEDPGPLQNDEQSYSLVDFDRLEMGSAFIIKVVRGDFYSVHIRGDRRNLNDLDVFKDGNTLVIRYDDFGNRRHDTYVMITMPVLRSVNFSGASNSIITGFTLDDSFSLILSGASVCQISSEFTGMDIVVSGASNLSLTGSGMEMNADVSGASYLQAYTYVVDQAFVEVSGASKAKVHVHNELKANASGSSVVYYRGDPSVHVNTSGSSSVVKD